MPGVPHCPETKRNTFCSFREDALRSEDGTRGPELCGTPPSGLGAGGQPWPGLQCRGSRDGCPKPTCRLAHARHAATSQFHNVFGNLLLPTHPHSDPRAYCMLGTPAQYRHGAGPRRGHRLGQAPACPALAVGTLSSFSAQHQHRVLQSEGCLPFPSPTWQQARGQSVLSTRPHLTPSVC